MRSIAESGMLYTVTATAVLICGIANNYAALLVASGVVKIASCYTMTSLADNNLQEMITVGIAFNLILIRAKQRDETQQEQRPSFPQFTTIGPTVSSHPSTLSYSMVWTESKP